MANKSSHLQIESSTASQNILYWRIRKIILIIVFLFLAAVFMGATGAGIFSERSVVDSDFSITYDAVTHRGGLQKIVITLANATPNTKVKISQAYLKNQYIKQITPTPVTTESRDDKYIFNFALNGPTTIVFLLEPSNMGLSKATIRLNDLTPVSFTQFNYP
jgi:hypothetical protein